jgi:AcrR family transcriptional regulator
MQDSLERVKMPPRSHKPESQKQERSLLTRQKLIDAARKVFARDGFEGASLQDISTLAGKTRGAFYSHFKDKEDVFFAIFEQDLISDRARFRKRLKDASTKEDRVVALASHIVNVIEDRERMLLALEFKMYVLRHPNEQKRLTDLHTAMCIRGNGNDLDQLFPELVKEVGSLESRRQAAQFGAIIDGLALNQLFDPGCMDNKTLLKQASAGISTIL